MKKEVNNPEKNIMKNTKIAVFEKKEIRKVFYNNEWWFSIVDVVEV